MKGRRWGGGGRGAARAMRGEGVGYEGCGETSKRG